jgi:hypothetical protein
MRRGAGVREEEEGRRCLAQSSGGEVACERTDRERVRRLVEWWRERWSEGTLNPVYI